MRNWFAAFGIVSLAVTALAVFAALVRHFGPVVFPVAFALFVFGLWVHHVHDHIEGDAK